jgi:hypothetical protein
MRKRPNVWSPLGRSNSFAVDDYDCVWSATNASGAHFVRALDCNEDAGRKLFIWDPAFCEWQPYMEPGATFATPFEEGCVVKERADAEGNFLGADSEGVEVLYSTGMVVGHPEQVAHVGA